MRRNLAKHVERVFERHGIDDEFGLEGLDFFNGGEPLGVVHKAQAARVGIIDGRGVVETEQVYKKRTHLAGAKNKDAHGCEGLFFVHHVNLLAHALFVDGLEYGLHKL